MVSIQLSDEEKLQVLIVALLLFVAASILSICLAAAVCPLNRWLTERHERKRRRQQHDFSSRFNVHNNSRCWSHSTTGSRKVNGRFVANAATAAASTALNQQHYLAQQHKSASSATLTSYLGPPPAYEAALRASRLQSITSLNALGTNSSSANSNNPPPSPDWLQSALNSAKNNDSSVEPQPLDLGDYFHAPKEFAAPLSVFGGAADQTNYPHVCIPMANNNGQLLAATTSQQSGTTKRPPPVMLRLWVSLMDPGELVARAREQLEASASTNENSKCDNDDGRGGRLTRQLSIPQLFGSLMSLTGSKSSSNIEQQQQQQQATNTNEQQLNSFTNELSSLSSQESSLSSSNNSHPNKQTITDSNDQSNETQSTSNDEQPKCPAPEVNKPKPACDSNNNNDNRPTQPNNNNSTMRFRRRCSPISPITSRVLHMNVASFSYVKDESLISTKRHNQMNFNHFYSQPNKTPPTIQQAQISSKNSSKSMCQLLISICDIENLLNSSWLNERACARLAQSSSIYIQCEILTTKLQVTSTAARLLRNPLKVLQHQTSSSSLQTHTVDFKSEIPATAIEQTPPPTSAKQDSSLEQAPQPDELQPPERQQQHATESETICDQQKPDLQQIEVEAPNWRHEPQANGKSIVVFQSVPKQLMQQQHQQHQAADSTSIDLIQFDSVFVSPILSRSTLEDGCLRFRVYSQCKYVNETCLAELKLPLKHLVRAQTRDNLGDASVRPQKQADLILNNLLANLVTASTGSPLSTLIEQISAERDEDPAGQATDCSEQKEEQQANTNPFASMFPWQTRAPTVAIQGNNSSLPRSSSSLGVTLFSSESSSAQSSKVRTGDDTADDDDDDTDEERWRLECERRIEQNYCRSLMVSHWLNYLVAPSYECQTVEETRGQLYLGITYLPTSNRLLFNAHKATIELDSLSNRSANSTNKQLIKKLRLQSDTSYLVRFMMLASGRVSKRKQTGAAQKPEWDSQEAVTFDLVNVSVEQPSFIVALVMRNSRVGPTLLTGSLQNLPTLANYSGLSLSTANVDQTNRPSAGGVQSEPESLRSRVMFPTDEGAIYRHRANLSSSTGIVNNHDLGSPAITTTAAAAAATSAAPSSSARRFNGRTAKDLVIGHFVLSDEIWHELRAQPRKQIMKQFKLV